MRFFSVFALAIAGLLTLNNSIASKDTEAQNPPEQVVPTITFLQQFRTRSGLDIRYSSSIIKSRIKLDQNMTTEQTIRYLDTHFNTISRFKDKQLVGLDILPKGEHSKTDLIQLTPTPQTPSDGTFGFQAEQHPNWESLSQQEKASLKKQTAEARFSAMKQQMSDRKKKQQQPIKEHLIRLRETDPDRYQRTKHRYSKEMIQEIEQGNTGS
jgi:hypothetical protein